MMPVAILAGGLATRLRPITQKLPKSLVIVAGKPFIYYQLKYLRAQNIHSVVLCIGFLGEKIREFVGDGSAWGLRVNYSYDGDNLLGTGGSIKNALPLLGESFFVLYGDSYLPINYLEVQNAFLSNKKRGLITIIKNNNKQHINNVVYHAGNVIEYNKFKQRENMNYLEYGLGVMHGSVFNKYSLGKTFDLAEVYNKLSLDSDLHGYEIFDNYYEIGSKHGITETNKYLIREKRRDKL